MILGLGTDIIENDRIRDLLSKHGDRFLNRIFTREEVEYARSHVDPVPYLAARFAVKEASIKALNLPGEMGVSMKEVEVAGSVFGKKKLVLHGKVKKIAEQMGARHFHLSLSHGQGMSMAVVILED
ncbi:MAG: holo-ACP synthase [Spirochaetia bacterium]|nr:holo-ACP synthase [Spirochaetia bacterium]